jgi:hypothetical protein
MTDPRALQPRDGVTAGRFPTAQHIPGCGRRPSQGSGAKAGRQRLDLSRDPPPDLAIETDVSRSCLDRLAIYARL